MNCQALDHGPTRNYLGLRFTHVLLCSLITQSQWLMNERVWGINGIKLTEKNLSNHGKTSPSATYSTTNAVWSVLGSIPESVAKGRPVIVRGVTDKSLARPGRKQATATKLGIYSTYSPRSSIYLWARCSNFCKPLRKKKSEVCPSNQVSAAAMTSALDEKWRTFNYFFQSREQVVVRRGQIRKIGWVIKTLEAQVGQFLLGCKCQLSRGIVVQEQDPLVNFPRRFSFKMPFICTSRDE